MHPKYHFILVSFITLSSTIGQAKNTCDNQFLQEYMARKKCVGGVMIQQQQGQNRDQMRAQIESGACMELGILEQMKELGPTAGAVGVGAAVGGLVGKMVHSMVKAQGAEALEKYEKFLKALKAEHGRRNEVAATRKDIEDEITSKATKGKYKSLKDLQTSVSNVEYFKSNPFGGHSRQDWEKKAARPGESYQETLARYEAERKTLDEVEKQSKKRIESEMSKYKGTDVYEYWKAEMGQYADHTKVPIRKKFEEIYVEESKVLKKYQDEIDQKQRALSEADMKMDRKDPRLKKLHQELYQAQDAFGTFYRKAPPNVKFADFMLRNAPVSYLDMDRIGLSSASQYKVEQHGKEVRDFKESSRSSGISKGVKAGVGASLLTEAIAFGGMFVVQDSDLKSCQSQLKLSSREIEYLRTFSYGQKFEVNARDASMHIPYVHSNANCSSFSLSDPEAVVKDFQSQGGIPDGLCQMMQNENNRLLKLEGESSAHAELTCDKFRDTNVSYDANEGKTVCRQSAYNMETEMIPGTDWPNYQRAKILTADGKTDKRRQMEFEAKYNKEYPASSMPANLDVVQKSRGCEHNVSVPCECLKANTKVQIAKRVQSQMCGDSNTARSVSPEAAPGTAKTKSAH